MLSTTPSEATSANVRAGVEMKASGLGQLEIWFVLAGSQPGFAACPRYYVVESPRRLSCTVTLGPGQTVEQIYLVGGGELSEGFMSFLNRLASQLFARGGDAPSTSLHIHDVKLTEQGLH